MRGIQSCTLPRLAGVHGYVCSQTWVLHLGHRTATQTHAQGRMAALHTWWPGWHEPFCSQTQVAVPGSPAEKDSSRGGRPREGRSCTRSRQACSPITLASFSCSLCVALATCMYACLALKRSTWPILSPCAARASALSVPPADMHACLQLTDGHGLGQFAFKQAHLQASSLQPGYLSNIGCHSYMHNLGQLQALVCQLAWQEAHWMNIASTGWLC